MCHSRVTADRKPWRLSAISTPVGRGYDHSGMTRGGVVRRGARAGLVACIAMRAFLQWGGFMVEYMTAFFLIGISIGLFFQGLELTQLRKRLAALSRIEAKLDLVLQHAGLKYVPYANLPATVIDALQKGNKIQAIKLYREATGVGLKDAKDFIEEIMATSTSHETTLHPKKG
jgi:Ribosomal protein L7/L12 C-terminal domain